MSTGEHMAGQLQASKFITALRATTPDPDALLIEFQRANTSPARARGFARVVQKQLERIPTEAGIVSGEGRNRLRDPSRSTRRAPHA